MFGLSASLVATILTGAVASRTACSIARDLRRETFTKVMHFPPVRWASLARPAHHPLHQRHSADSDGRNSVYPHVPDGPVMGIVAVMRVLANHTGLEWTIAVAIIAVSAVVGVLMGLTMPVQRCRAC
ncbi:MAG: hypothetical protein ACLRM9_03990 [Collinsella aerofaciens]